MLSVICEFCLRRIPNNEPALEIQCGERWQHLGLVCNLPECLAKAEKLIALRKAETE